MYCNVTPANTSMSNSPLDLLTTNLTLASKLKQKFQVRLRYDIRAHDYLILLEIVFKCIQNRHNY